MRMYDIIMKKRNGEALTKEEIDHFVQGYTEGKIPDYQASALLMSIYFQKMNESETKDLTESMVKSGEEVDLSKIEGTKVDKHSTGGVGDTTTMVLAPLVASAGVPVAKMSGRGLGHTGGTLDKLESIEGFSVQLSMEEFVQSVNEKKIAVAAQTADLAPADKKLYSLRDVTATIDDISLIASSIMSKKIAAGSDAIVLDVKAGSGAFMKEYDEAVELGKSMVDIGNGLGRKTIAVVSAMDQPLGRAVGNSLEVKEAIKTLKGEGPEDLTELCLTLGSHMLVLSGEVEEEKEGRELLKELLENGKALEKFKEFVSNQGGHPDVLDDPGLLPQAEGTYVFEDVRPAVGHLEVVVESLLFLLGLAVDDLVAAAGAERRLDDVGDECGRRDVPLDDASPIRSRRPSLCHDPIDARLRSTPVVAHCDGPILGSAS